MKTGGAGSLGGIQTGSYSMCDEVDVQSPPFPQSTTNVPKLLECLSELRGWVVYYQDWANLTFHEIGGDAEIQIVPIGNQLPTIPTMQHFTLCGVADMFNTYMLMRRIRESWDKMIRTWENDWENKNAIVWRLRTIRMAVQLLNQAFILPEHREAKVDAFHKKMTRFSQKVARKLGVPDELMGGKDAFDFLNEEGAEDDDDDDLFSSLMGDDEE